MSEQKHKYKVGDRLLLGNGGRKGWEPYVGREIVVTGLGWANEPFYHSDEMALGAWEGWVVEALPSADATSPDYYKFPGGGEVKDISAHLSSFGGQALQYIARSTRLDGNNKGEPVENLRKAIKFLEWEIERLEAS